MRRTWIAALGLLLPACGSTVITTPGGSGGSGGGSSESVCPASEPKGGSCFTPGFRCTYGESARPECRHEWACENGHWTAPKSVCLSPPPSHCDFQSPPSGTCTQQGDVCIIADSTLCQCDACAGGPCMLPPPKWTCAGPPATAGCPAKVPNDGTACDKEALSCTYGTLCSLSGVAVVCQGGLWKWQEPAACAQ